MTDFDIFRQIIYVILKKKNGVLFTMNEEYLYLFNVVTDAISELEKIKKTLILAQQNAEEMYISSDKKNT